MASMSISPGSKSCRRLRSLAAISCHDIHLPHLLHCENQPDLRVVQQQEEDQVHPSNLQEPGPGDGARAGDVEVLDKDSEEEEDQVEAVVVVSTTILLQLLGLLGPCQNLPRRHLLPCPGVGSPVNHTVHCIVIISIHYLIPG